MNINPFPSSVDHTSMPGGSNKTSNNLTNETVDNILSIASSPDSPVVSICKCLSGFLKVLLGSKTSQAHQCEGDELREILAQGGSIQAQVRKIETAEQAFSPSNTAVRMSRSGKIGIAMGITLLSSAVGVFMVTRHGASGYRDVDVCYQPPRDRTPTTEAITMAY